MTTDELATQMDGLTDTVARLEAQYEDQIAGRVEAAAFITATLLREARLRRHRLNEQLLALGEQATPSGEAGGRGHDH